jgi:hypothetical protein
MAKILEDICHVLTQAHILFFQGWFFLTAVLRLVGSITRNFSTNDTNILPFTLWCLSSYDNKLHNNKNNNVTIYVCDYRGNMDY